MFDVLLLDAGRNWAWHVVLVGLVALVGIVIIVAAHTNEPDPLSHLPRYEVVADVKLASQFSTAETLLRHAYAKVGNLCSSSSCDPLLTLSQHPEDPFVVGGTWRRWDTVILPPKVFDSIKSLSEDELSFYDALDKVHYGPLLV